MRQAAKVLLTFLLLPVAALAGMVFPHFEFRRFIEPPSMILPLTSRVIDVIERHSEFQPEQFRVDVSQEVCSWDLVEELRELTEQPGWQLTAGTEPDIWFKKTSFWPWDRHGLIVSVVLGRPCSAAVQRSDTI